MTSRVYDPLVRAELNTFEEQPLRVKDPLRLDAVPRLFELLIGFALVSSALEAVEAVCAGKPIGVDAMQRLLELLGWCFRIPYGYV